jgi:hypothetical protein
MFLDEEEILLTPEIVDYLTMWFEQNQPRE